MHVTSCISYKVNLTNKKGLITAVKLTVNFHNVENTTFEFNSRIHSEDGRLFQYTCMLL
jgi:hypothetical protein